MKNFFIGSHLKKVFILCFILTIIIIGYNIINESIEFTDVFYFQQSKSFEQSNSFEQTRDPNQVETIYTKYNLDGDDTTKDYLYEGEDVVENYRSLNISSEYLVLFNYVGYFEFRIPNGAAFKCRGLDDNFYYVAPLDNSTADIGHQLPPPSHPPVDMEIYFDIKNSFQMIDDSSSKHVPRMLITLEPPPFRGCEFEKSCVESFNFKLSFESKSDVRLGFDSKVSPFEEFRKLPLSLILETQNQFKNDYEQRKLNNSLLAHQTSFPMIDWFCSNCETQSNRIEYVKELMKYMVIDSYGNCLKNMPTPDYLGRRSDDPFNRKRLFITKYKFTIVFENSLCKDYVSEKVLDALSAGSVPIFMAHPSTIKYLPYQSYIYVGDFDSAEELANHLKYLGENDIEYNKFHAWRSNETAIDQWKGVNNYPNKPGFRLRELQCPMLRHFLRLKTGKIHLKKLKYKPFNQVCLPWTYFSK
ncbi:hypothetical protein ACTFIR_010541 [Dictyostelium discoideum]